MKKKVVKAERIIDDEKKLVRETHCVFLLVVVVVLGIHLNFNISEASLQ